MNKPRKSIVCAVTYLMVSALSVSLFGLFSAWAMSELDPSQQAAIAATMTPWIASQRDSTLNRAGTDNDRDMVTISGSDERSSE